MLTFTSLGNASLRITGGGRPLTVFAEKAADPNDLLIQSVPMESPPAQIICWPGEYHIGGVTVRGVGHAEGQQVSFLAVVDGMRCAFVSSPLVDWSDAELEQLGDVDALVIPADDPKLVQKLVDEIDPRVLLLLPGKSGVPSEELIRAFGAQDKPAVTEYKLKTLPAEGREVVVLGGK